MIDLPNWLKATVFCSVAAIAFAWPLGYNSARLETTFAMPEGEEPCVAIRVRSEGILCASIDLNARTVLRSFEFIDVHAKRVRTVTTGRLQTFDPPDKSITLSRVRQ